jgi:hypothetical protein
MANNETDNKFWIFKYLFIFVIIIGLLSFFLFGLYFIGYEYALKPISDLSKLGLNATGQAQVQATSIANKYLSNAIYLDYLFLIFVIGAVYTSIQSAIIARRIGWFSFFGFYTIGIILFTVLMSYVIKLKDWIYDNFTANIVTTPINAPIYTFVSDNIFIIIFVWFIILILLQFIDIRILASKIFEKKQLEQEAQQDLSTTNVDSMFSGENQQ